MNGSLFKKKKKVVRWEESIRICFNPVMKVQRRKDF